MSDITSNLVARWTMDDTSGTTCVDSTGSYNGTYMNSPTLNVAGAFGSSKAVTFASASSQYVNLGSKGSFTPDQTIAFWVNATDLASANKGVIGFGGASVEISTTFVRYYGDYAAASGVTFATTLTTGGWYHIVCVQSSTTGTVYVNGVSLGSKTVQALSATARSSYLALAPLGVFLPGTLDDVRIYNRAFAAGDVAALVAYTDFLPFILDDCE